MTQRISDLNTPLSSNSYETSEKEMKALASHLGMLHFNADDVYHFNDGLAGFKHHVSYVRLPLPQMEHNNRYGLLQSSEDPDLSFILFYPELSEAQLSIITQKVRAVMIGDPRYQITPLQWNREHIRIAFLVIIEKSDDQKTSSDNLAVRCVSNAPIVFVESLKRGWQIALH